MNPRWTVYSEAIDDPWNEERFNDCFADLVADAVTRSPEFLNYLLDGTVEFGPEAGVAATQRDVLPHRKEGPDRALDLAIEDDSTLVGFESKRGDSLSEAQLRDEVDKLEYNADERDVILVAVTEDWEEPEIISEFPESVRWNSWHLIADRVFDADGLDVTWNPTISRAGKMFHAFGHREIDSREAQELSARVEGEKKRWDGRFVGQFEPESWSDEWTAKSPAGHIFKDGWRLDWNLEPTTRKSPVALQFVHHLRDEDLVSRGLLKFQFRWDGGGDKEHRDRFAAWFTRELEESDLDLTNRDIKQSGRDYVFTEKIYEFDVERFPYSYYEKLREAFEEHQVIVDFLEERDEVSDIVRK
jgi:hypothetical protein